MDVNAFLTRARSMLDRETVYWAGCGGKDPRAALASESVNPGQQWRALNDTLQRRYASLKTLFDLDDPQLRVMACDCSGFVCWALGFARKGPRTSYSSDSGEIYTDSIYADAMGLSSLAPGQSERRFEQQAPGSIAVGSLLVYPKPRNSDDPYGHIGIVVETEAGRPSAVLHCSAENFRSTGDAIRVTDTRAFDDPALGSVAVRSRTLTSTPRKRQGVPHRRDGGSSGRYLRCGHGGIDMNQRRVSEIFFEEQLDVTSLHGDAVQVLLGLCERALQPALDQRPHALHAAVVVTHDAAPLPAHGRALLSGWVERIGDDLVVFRLVARIEGQQVLDRTLEVTLHDRPAPLLVSRQVSSCRTAEATCARPGPVHDRLSGLEPCVDSVTTVHAQ